MESALAEKPTPKTKNTVRVPHCLLGRTLDNLSKKIEDEKNTLAGNIVVSDLEQRRDKLRQMIVDGDNPLIDWAETKATDPLGASERMEFDFENGCNLDAIAIRNQLIDYLRGLSGAHKVTPLGVILKTEDTQVCIKNNPLHTSRDLNTPSYSIGQIRKLHGPTNNLVDLAELVCWVEDTPKETEKDCNKKSLLGKFVSRARGEQTQRVIEVAELPIHIGLVYIRPGTKGQRITVPLLTSQVNESGCHLVYPAGSPLSLQRDVSQKFYFNIHKSLDEFAVSSDQVSSSRNLKSYTKSSEKNNEVFVGLLSNIIEHVDISTEEQRRILSSLMREIDEPEVANKLFKNTRKQILLNEAVAINLLADVDMIRKRTIYAIDDTEKQMPREHVGRFFRLDSNNALESLSFSYQEALSSEYHLVEQRLREVFRVDIDVLGNAVIGIVEEGGDTREPTRAEYAEAIKIIQNQVG